MLLAAGLATLIAFAIASGVHIAGTAVGAQDGAAPAREMQQGIAAAGAQDGAAQQAALSPFADASEYSRQCGGEFLMVMRGGSVIHEDGLPGWDRTRPHALASGTKSFTGVAAMLAVQAGLIDLDEPVCSTITQWKDDPRKRSITPRHLLSLSSGLQANTEADRLRIRAASSGSLKDRVRAGLDQRNADFHAQGIAVPALHEPGAHFEYGSNHYFAFSAFLERRLRERSVEPATTWEWYETALLTPLGIEVARIGRDSEGHPQLAGGLSLSAQEWAKFGEFVRLGGQVRAADGSLQQLLRSDLLAECFKPSKAKAEYGLTWWLVPAGEQEPQTVLMAAGLGGQRLYVMPEQELVVIRFAPITGGTKGYQDAKMVSLLRQGALVSPAQPRPN